MIPIKRFIVWMSLTFMTVLVLCIEIPMNYLSAVALGIGAGIAWEIALRYLEEPNDWN